MRIRFVSPWYPDYLRVHSGIFVAKQVAAIRESGHEVTVDVPQIFPAPPGPIPRSVSNAMRTLARKSRSAMFASTNGVTYVPTPVPSRGGPMGRARAMSDSLSLLAEFRDETPDLIHAHLGMPTAWAVSQTKHDLPLVVTEHQSTLAAVFAEPPSARAYHEVVSRADAFICVSEHLRDQIADALGDWTQQRIGVIPNIVDLAEIPFQERPSPEFASWIYVGGLMAHKGVKTLLEVFAEFRDKHDDGARLTLVGDGPLRGWIEEFAASRGFASSVRLAGPVPHDQLEGFFARADVMVHLSPAETFGIAPLEAIGSGLPVVSLRNAGAVNTWGDIAQECGLLLPLEASPKEIAEAISELARSNARLRPAVGRQAVLDRYSPAVVTRRLMATYAKVLR